MIVFVLEVCGVILLVDVLKEVFPTGRAWIHGKAKRIREKIK